MNPPKIDEYAWEILHAMVQAGTKYNAQELVSKAYDIAEAYYEAKENRLNGSSV